MDKRYVVAAACLAAAASISFAQDKACSPADSTKAEQMVDRVVNWDQLYKAWQDFGHCDKGTVDEVFTDALLRCLVEWKHVDVLARTMEKDKAYREFVQRHLNSPAAKGDLQNIYSRAKMSCPKGLETFCNEMIVMVRPFSTLEMMPAMADTAPAAPAPAAAPKK